MKLVRTLGWLVFLMCALAVSSRAQSVQSDFDKSYDFSKMKTFNFAIPGFDDPLAHDSLNDGRIRAALESNLMSNGFGMEELERPDFAVAYYVTAKNKFNVSDYGPPRFFGRREISVSEYTEGTLTIEMFDTATRRLVWRGRASGTVEMKGTDKKINKAVEKLVKQFLKDTTKKG